MKSLKETIELINRNKKSLIILEIFTKAFLLAIMVPVLNALFKISLKAAGISYIALENLGRYFTQYFTIIMILFIFCIIGIYTTAEISFLCIFYYTGQDRKFSFVKIFYPCLKRFKEIIKKQSKIIYLPNTVLGMLISMPIFLSIFSNERTIRYFTKIIFNNPIPAVICIICIILIIVFLFLGMFAMHITFIEDKNYKRAYCISSKIVRKNFAAIIRTIAVVNITVIAVFLAVCIVMISVSCFFIYMIMERELILAACMSFFNEIITYLIVALIVILEVINIAVISVFYMNLRDAEARTGYKGHYDHVLERMQYEEFEAGDGFDLYKLHTKRYDYGIRAALFIILCVNLFIFADAVRNGSVVFREGISGIMVTAHRGSSEEAPENTIPAIEKAIVQLADYVEVDVQETNDGVVILLHDKNLKRTTGINNYIWNVDYDELETYNAAVNFPEYGEVKIPAFDKVLETAKGNIMLNIEIKYNSNQQTLIEQVVNYIEEYDFEKQCVVTSSNYQVLKKVKALNSNIKTGYIMSFAYGDFYNMEYVDFFSIKSSFINESTVRQAHSVGKEIHAWTVNSKSEVIRLINIGVDNIITDRPVMVRELIYSEMNAGLFEILKFIFNNN